MNLKDLSKEQKRYIVMGIAGAVILIVLIILGARFSLSSIKDAKSQLAELSEKISAADRTLSRSDQVSSEFRSTMQMLKSHIIGVPPERNYYSWATEVIYSEARKAGLEIDSIDEINGNRGTSEENASKIHLESYALRMNAHGGFNDVKMFIEGLKEDYPLIRFTGLDITAGQQPESHDVQLWLQWPFNLNVLTESWESVEEKQHALSLTGSGKRADQADDADVPVESSEAKTEPVDTPKTIVPQQPTVQQEDEPRIQVKRKPEPPAVAPPVESAVPSEPEVPTPEPEEESGPQPEEQAGISPVEDVKRKPEPPAVVPPVESAVPSEPEIPTPEPEEEPGPQPEEQAGISPVEDVSPTASADEPTAQAGTIPPEPAAESIQEPVESEPAVVEPADAEPSVAPVPEPEDVPELQDVPEVIEDPLPEEPESAPADADVEKQEAQVEIAEFLAMDIGSEPETVADSPDAADEVELETESEEENSDSDAAAEIEMDASQTNENKAVQEEAMDEIELMLLHLQNESDLSAGTSEEEGASENPSDDAAADTTNNETPSDSERSASEEDSMYISTEKSARKLESFLVEEEGQETNESLDALLDSLIGGQP